jgi:hypothetical protein
MSEWQPENFLNEHRVRGQGLARWNTNMERRSSYCGTSAIHESSFWAMLIEIELTTLRGATSQLFS